MNKTLLLIIILYTSLFSSELPIDHVKNHNFYKKIVTNAKIVQLQNQKEELFSLLDAKIIHYYVKVGDRVFKGDPLLDLSSIELSYLTTQYLSIKKQYKSIEDNYNSSKKLYKKGLISKKELNQQSIQKNEIYSKLHSLKSNLKALSIDPNTLTKSTDKLTILAKSNSQIVEILKPINSTITRDTPIAKLSNKNSLYLKSYIPQKYASLLKEATKVSFVQGDKTITAGIKEILPNIDKESKKIVLLSSIDKVSDELFIDAFITTTIHIKPSSAKLSVKKTALSFYDNDWVIFVPKKEHESEHEDYEHEEEGHDEHEKLMFEARVVKILDQDDKFVAIAGVSEDEEYVSDKAYFVKSMLLKSAMGGHGH